MAKATQIKPWPNQTGEVAALCPLFSRRKKTNQNHLDLRLVEKISSCGLTILSLRLLKFLNQSKATYRVSSHEKTKDALDALGFFEIIERSKSIRLNDFFSLERHSSSQHCPEPPKDHFLHQEPIQYIEFTEARDPRRLKTTFIREISAKLENLIKNYYFPRSGLLTILNEIAKNSADHSGADAIFGFDIISTSKGSGQLCFVWGDLGPGLHEHYKENIPDEQKARLPYFDLTQSYRLALIGGNSSRSNSSNRGLGLPTIIEGCRCIGLRLHVFDANSMAALHHFSGLCDYSHREVRKRFVDVGHEIGFFYYGELDLRANEN